MGSAVPRQSKDGLQGIQEPLRSLYPSEGAVGAKGIDSWLSVWSNGILLENVDENLKQITRFFPIESLHYCAAVRQVLIPERGNSKPEPNFLPLDSPFARMPRAQHPPIFAAILRRTTGIKVLECHVFICKREAAANALVRCCFHAYADNSYARQLETGSSGGGAGSSVYGTLKSGISPQPSASYGCTSSQAGWRSRAGSTTTLNSVGRQSNGHIFNGTSGISLNGGGSNGSAAEGYTSVKNFYGSSADLNVIVDDGGNQTKTQRQKVDKTAWQPSLSGTLIRPKPIHPGTLQRPGLYAGAPGSVVYGNVAASGAYPPAHGSRNYHTISHRGFHGGPPGPTGPHSFHHPGMPPPPLPQMMHPSQIGVPLQMPKKDKKSSGIPVGLPMVPPIYAFHQSMGAPPPPPQPALTQSLIGESRPLAMSNRKLAASVGNGLDDAHNSGAESPGGTGIYRRKGHLNERAFSYSIRQEHRSRSHGSSLASLQFNPPDMKKEREIAQMVAGLDLNDSHEREMPPTTLQLKQMMASNGNAANIQQQAIYGNGGSNAIYGNKWVQREVLGNREDKLRHFITFQHVEHKLIICKK
ncbi:unnamed protein product [Ceratitis capitata]|uniref:(Mediterranean fruit fly) hypothetical protein n=1 Tax=Ceratitis capitata TaxID=7213 RepID=A0A811U9B2_CERCA|nr:unnamed protein product [Ceratitis capitata]